MKQAKSILTIWLILQFAFSLLAQNIYFHFSNASYSQYPLSDIHSVTFSANNMNLNLVGGSSVSIPLNTISSFNYTGYDGFSDIANLPESGELLLYPNPSEGKVNISYTSEVSGKVTMEVTSITGELLNVICWEGDSGNNQLTLNLTDTQGRCLPVGAYLCWIKTSTETMAKKIIITR